MTQRCPKCNTENPSESKFCRECAAPLPMTKDESASPTETVETPKEELSTGTTFAGRYQIIEELGKGGMGKVYKVLDTEIKEKVALKLMKPEVGADEKTIERFRNELKFSRKIAHRNVCKMYDLGEEKGTRYITMEYVPGEDLKSIIRMTGQLSIGRTISIAKQICEGLTEAHRLGVVHRDLKPRNIMIDREGDTRIMDFGIARSLETKGITGADVMIGTPEYISPEQVMGKVADQRSDIYSLGIILFEMVTGRIPFEGDTAIDIALKQKTEAAPDPRQFNAQIPEDLSLLVLKCMEKNKENRPQSAGEVRSELSRIAKDIPAVEKERPKRKPVTSKEITVTFGLKRLFVPAAIVIALIMAVVIILQFLPKMPAPATPMDRPSVGIMYFKNNTGDESLEHWRIALSDLMITDLAQSKHIRVLSGDRLFEILGEIDQLGAKSYSSDVLKKVAEKGRVNHILQGDYSQAGDNFRISVMLHDIISGELVGSKWVEGQGLGSFHSMVDELTPWVKYQFNIGRQEVAADSDMDVKEILSSSPEALKYYTQAKQYYQAGKFQESNEALKEAVKIDEGFALAYKRMSENYSYLGDLDQSERYAEMALSLKDRESVRDRYLVQGWAYTILDDSYARAIQTYEEMLQSYPDDEDGNTYLGAIYRNMEEWDLAMERFEKVIVVNPSIATENIFAFHLAKGQIEKARDFLRSWQDAYSNPAFYHLDMSLLYLIQREYARALDEAKKAFSLDPDYYLIERFMGTIHHLQDRFQESEVYYRRLLDKNNALSRLTGRIWLVHLYLAQGQYENSRREIIQGIEDSKKFRRKSYECAFLVLLTYLNLQTQQLEEGIEASNQAMELASEIKMQYDKISTLHFRGLIQLKMNKIDEAKETAGELKHLIEKLGILKSMRHYYCLMGMIAQNENMISLAVENFEKAVSLLSHQPFDEHALFLFPLAQSYYQLGDWDKARDQFEKIIELTVGRVTWSHIYAKSHYMLGKIYEEMGDRGKAKEHYEKFLKIWEEADSSIPEVEDAKKKLAELKNP
jgi:serine/threonine protein kinase/Tfp pilus assembly protein PilF